MGNFVKQLQINSMDQFTYTENGMPTNYSSGNYLLDFFYKAPASSDYSNIISLFYKAFEEDSMNTLKALFYLRDIRAGQGRRQSFREIINNLANNHPDIARKIYKLIPEYGRWDDLLGLLDTDLQKDVAYFIYKAINNGNNLAAKWMPRDNKKNKKYARKLQRIWKMTPKQYRKFLVNHTNVVESLMCENNWRKIHYEHVPSRAMLNYKNAFKSHDPMGFSYYINKVNSGEATIHSGALYPHDIVHNYNGNNADACIALWNNLPNFVKENNFIPVCDVSGSMYGTPMEISISLGIYLSEKNTGEFKDTFITFSKYPCLQVLKGTLPEKIDQLYRAAWTMNTDLNAVFDLILNTAINNNIAEEELPKNILIISDMQFDRCISYPDMSATELIKYKYNRAGYNMPNVVFWNVKDSSGVPVKMHENGYALIGGYSPSIMQYLSLDNITPMSIMMDVLNSGRYSNIEEIYFED